MGEIRNTCKDLTENSEGKRHRGRNGQVGFIWLRIGSSGGLL
jgi:hypothetical protein